MGVNDDGDDDDDDDADGYQKTLYGRSW